MTAELAAQQLWHDRYDQSVRSAGESSRPRVYVMCSRPPQDRYLRLWIAGQPGRWRVTHPCDPVEKIGDGGDRNREAPRLSGSDQPKCDDGGSVITQAHIVSDLTQCSPERRPASQRSNPIAKARVGEGELCSNLQRRSRREGIEGSGSH